MSVITGWIKKVRFPKGQLIVICYQYFYYDIVFHFVKYPVGADNSIIVSGTDF